MVTLKVCGITSAADAQAAAAAGAQYLGFIFYPKSPRFVSPDAYRAMATSLPATVGRVAVCVQPTPVDLAALNEFGFDAFQIHFETTEPTHHIAAWADAIGVNKLWLAPKLPPAEDIRPEWLKLAQSFLLDAYHADRFGGTGQTSDWEKFQRHQLTHPAKRWILSGGLSPANIREAIGATGATMVDVNSGVESSPGVKDPAKLAALRSAL
jgi:phosphoribosylanthranilate isomerase